MNASVFKILSGSPSFLISDYKFKWICLMCRALIYILVMLVLASSPAITNAQTEDIYAKAFNCGKKFVTFAAMRKDITWSQWTLRKSDIMAIDKDMDPDPKTRNMTAITIKSIPDGLFVFSEDVNRIVSCLD